MFYDVRISTAIVICLSPMASVGMLRSIAFRPAARTSRALSVIPARYAISSQHDHRLIKFPNELELKKQLYDAYFPAMVRRSSLVARLANQSLSVSQVEKILDDSMAQYNKSWAAPLTTTNIKRLREEVFKFLLKDYKTTNELKAQINVCNQKIEKMNIEQVGSFVEMGVYTAGALCGLAEMMYSPSGGGFSVGALVAYLCVKKGSRANHHLCDNSQEAGETIILRDKLEKELKEIEGKRN